MINKIEFSAKNLIYVFRRNRTAKRCDPHTLRGDILVGIILHQVFGMERIARNFL